MLAYIQVIMHLQQQVTSGGNIYAGDPSTLAI